ncbi:dTDP-4-amino-4,6-dideoxygalactose transaminase [Ancylobacter amanitiformis]|uniref:dTDP-4-amino-4,6-dideoxygalactose transaminase n=1 Tax=Ancylobacter amanitiformis TaxID=217069 RepID=A0ABU0LWM7_9HYPH|nr:dTDP-4-amino-4,6-dideoxygalactose transaminase [Ancylobacter amanitiformis]MDQ0513085.1 dTDP-4-amino-4,6-dideoxygalactose transaminase [Ancylobacter amanitiformis]
MLVPFNRIELAGPELDYIREALGETVAGNGRFTQLCQQLLEQSYAGSRVLLTTSCTSALEMAGLLAGLGPGDEVIMPSFTFTSTANAVVLRGGVPVFVDIRPDTQNIDETRIEAAITPRTRAICVVHYAGVGCEMTAIGEIARRHGLTLIEDAAQAIGSTYRGRPLGTFGELSALSFHETKNVISGEGGALIINDPELMDRAEILWEKGTDRVRFRRGLVTKYTWVDVGSSFLPSDITAAFLYSQLQSMEAIIADRLGIWERYHAGLEPLEARGLITRPTVPDGCTTNGHIYYVLLDDANARDRWAAQLAEAGIDAFMHYVPLHSSPAGRRFGRTHGDLAVTDATAGRLLRLPVFPGMTAEQADLVIHAMHAIARGPSVRQLEGSR